MDDAAYEALMARLNEAYPSQPAYTPPDVKLQSGQITQQQGQDPVILTNPRTLQQGESNPIEFDQSGGVSQLGAMMNAGRLRGMLDMSGQDGMTPGYNAMGTMQLPEGYSASYRRSNEIGGLGDAQNAIMLAKQFGEPNTPSPSLSAGASRSGMNGPITYDLSGSVPLTTGRNPEAPQFRLPSSREEAPMVPPTRWEREHPRQPSRQEVRGAATAGLSHSPRDHSTRANAGLKFNFADGGHVDAALHLLRQHFDEGGFLSSLSNLFSGPDVMSTGNAPSPGDWGNPELASDFFKADKAMRLAQQAREPEAAPPRQIQERAPVETPRQQIASPPPAPAPAPVRQAFTPVRVEDLAVPPAPEPRAVNPYDFGRAVTEHQMGTMSFPHLTERPGFAQSLNLQDMPRADMTPEIGSRRLQNYTLPEAALVPPAPQAEINNAVSLARETIPDFNTALANVEKLHDAGVYSGEALDKAGEILQAHNRARDAGIPVEEALRLNRAEGPRMVNQGMPREERPAVQPLAYTAAPTPAPAAQAISEAMPATGKLTARAPQGPDLNDRQRDLIIRTIAAETSGKSPEESQAIAHVILNRIQSGKYGATPEAVLFARKQFEPWSNPNGANYPMRFTPESRRYGLGQTALDAALGAEDITKGATNFWAPKAQAALGRPAPRWGRTGGVDIGETRFHNLSRAEGGEVEGPDEVNQALDVVRQAPETNALGMTPDQFAEYTQTKAPPTPSFVEDALRNVREYAMPRGEDYTHAMDQSAAAADYLTKSGKEGMLSGNPWEMAKGAGMSMLGTALPVIAPVGAAIEAGVVNPAGRVLGPAGRQAAEVATMVPGEGVGAALKIARATGEAAPVVTAMSMIPKAAETVAPVRKSLDDIVGGWENKGVKLDVSGGGEKPFGISRIVVPENMRNQGIGSQVMNDLITHADDANKIMTLTPSKDFGASSVDRLKDFYKKFGFVENKGKNKDYAISDTMYRKPTAAEPQMGADLSSIGAAQELANKAMQTYGTTHNIAEAGYVLPNGKMLDFSGRHEAGYNRMGDRFVPKQGERDWLANDRAVDHRDVVHMMTGPEGMEGHEGMTKFMADASAIRNKPGIGFEAATIPTDKQIKTIVSSHNTKYRGEPMLVELSHPTTGDIVASRDFEKPNVEAIQKWFSEQAQANPDIKLAPKFSRGGKTGGSVVDRALMLVSRQA